MDDMEVIVFEDLPSKKTPLDADNLNKIQQNAKKAIKNRKPTIELLTVSSAAPSTCAVGDKYYNTTTSKIYTAIAKNMWATTGENPSSLYLYADLEHKELYYYDGTDFKSYGSGKKEVGYADEQLEGTEVILIEDSDFDGENSVELAKVEQNLTSNSENTVPSVKAVNNGIKTNIITGQEVATNEYIDGKRVYKRNISAIGENSSGTTLTLSNINFNFSEIWIDESNSFISNEIETLSINWYFAPEDYCRVWIGKNTKIIRYRTGGNLSGRTFNVMLKYTKNT